MRNSLIFFTVISFMTMSFADDITSRPRVGLVLSGGGAKGAAQIAVLKVLDSLQIEIDYIAGTSMGSFLGALYAIGYSADRIEKIFYSHDWNKIMFQDQVSRSSLSISEKADHEKYISAFPLRRWKIELPGGLNPGQSLSSIIAHYVWPVNHRDDFSKFPTPFLCIGTNIETGGAVVLEKGFLPDAIRASMAFPSVLSPIEINNQLLVDGGLARNFPIRDLKERGMDIVIGVDVGAKLYAKDELNSVVKVLEQISSYGGAASTAEQRNLCDILISPDITGYDAGRFDAIDVLYKQGEIAVQKVLPELEALAEAQKKHSDSKPKFIPLDKYHPIHVKEIKTQGLSEVSARLLYGNLLLSPDSYVDPLELEAAIDRVYGSQYFERVSYKFEPDSSGVDLIIRVKERTIDQFKFGVHYDSDMRSAVLLNSTFRNKLVQGSKLSFDMRLSSNPSARATYQIATGKQPGLGMGLDLAFQNFEVPIYQDTGFLVALMDYSSYVSSLWLGTIVSNSHSVGIWTEWSVSTIEPIFYTEAVGNYNEDDNFSPKLLNFAFSGRYDTFDRAVFPSKGVKLYVESKLYTDEFTASEANRHKHFNRSFITLNHVFKLSDSFSWFYGVYAGVINRIHIKLEQTLQQTLENQFITASSVKDNEVPGDVLFWIGGISNDQSSIYPFIGSKFMEYSSKEASILKAGLQLEVLNDKFVTLTINKAFLKEQYIYDRPEDSYLLSDVELLGYGLTLGMQTPVGPMEYTLMGRSGSNELLTHLSIGYYF